jgi:hypothetical protein
MKHIKWLLIALKCLFSLAKSKVINSKDIKFNIN